MDLDIVDRDRWEPRRFHGVDGAQHVWRRTDEGIEVRGEDGVRRTKGEPLTLRRILQDFGPEISDTSIMVGVPEKLIAGVVAAESRGYPEAEREEPHLNDVSIGLTQTLTATANHLAVRAPSALGLRPVARLTPVPDGGDVESWRHLLTQPHYAIRLAALYLAFTNDEHDLQFDPVLCYAAYNAGSLRPSSTTPWGMHYYRKQLPDGRWADAMDNFTRWYGDACHVYGYC